MSIEGLFVVVIEVVVVGLVIVVASEKVGLALRSHSKDWLSGRSFHLALSSPSNISGRALGASGPK
jgi:hypothetical protein